jgi:hexosaminidase
LNCNGKYEGQLDPTLNLTWEVLTSVLNYTNSTFADDYIHFGGDEVVYDCWGTRPAIVAWMKTNNISNYKSLSTYFRQRQKTLWRTISPKKKVIYWANEDIDLPVQDDDVIHWWGVSSNVNKLAGRKNEVILSTYDIAYLDIGFGNYYGKTYGSYENWRKTYNFEPRIANVNVIGGASCMWNEIANHRTFEQKVIQRASVIGERLWNVKVDLKIELRNIATRLTAHS